MLTSKQRAALRREANGLSPVFQVGKDGVDQPLVQATESCLAARELIKLRALETSPHTAREAADALAEATGAQVVQVIGNTLVLFRVKAEDSAFAAMLGLPQKAKKDTGKTDPGIKPGHRAKAARAAAEGRAQARTPGKAKARQPGNKPSKKANK